MPSFHHSNEKPFLHFTLGKAPLPSLIFLAYYTIGLLSSYNPQIRGDTWIASPPLHVKKYYKILSFPLYFESTSSPPTQDAFVNWRDLHIHTPCILFRWWFLNIIGYTTTCSWGIPLIFPGYGHKIRGPIEATILQIKISKKINPKP
jgi:hypothetical protein